MGKKKVKFIKIFLLKSKAGGNSLDVRDNLKIGLTTTRTASLGPQIGSVVPITQCDNHMVKLYKLTNLTNVSFFLSLLSRTKETKSNIMKEDTK